ERRDPRQRRAAPRARRRDGTGAGAGGAARVGRDEHPGHAVKERAAKALEAAGIVLTAAERDAIEIADFGLGDFERTGLAVLVYVNTDRVCAKELVLLPGQLC